MALLVGPTGRVLGIDKYPQLVEASLRSIGADHPELLEGGRVRLRAGNVLAAGELKGEGPFDAIHVGAGERGIILGPSGSGVLVFRRRAHARCFGESALAVPGPRACSPC
jgi:hypothetical protein